MANTIDTKPLSGYMELLPREQRLFNRMLDTIRAVYEENGFIPMDQPIVDRTESLLANVGGDTTKELIRIARDDDKELALRFDLTVPLARYVANNYGSLSFPFRRYAIGKVYRGERAQAGRFREFYQCDVDIIGNEQLAIGYDADIILMIARLFEQLNTEFNIGNINIKINNRKIVQGIFESLNIENKTQALRALDKKEKLTESEFEDELQKIGLTETQTLSVINIIRSTSEIPSLTYDADFKLLKNKIVDELTKRGFEINQTLTEGFNEMQYVSSILSKSNYAENILIDLSIARGLDYYTGTVFETFLLDKDSSELRDIGSVCSGGRYDDLAGAYTNRSLPGVGTSIGLTRLFDQLRKKEIISPDDQQTQSQVLIAPLTSNFSQALELQNALLNNDTPISCEVFYATKKENNPDKAVKYADKLGIPYLAMIGADEIAAGTITLQNMESGDKQSLTISEITSKLSLGS